MGYCSNTSCVRCFRYWDGQVDLMRVQPHNNCLQLGEAVGSSALGALPKQQQHNLLDSSADPLCPLYKEEQHI